MKKKTKIIQVPMPEDLVDQLDAAAAHKGESRSAFIRDACVKSITAEAEEELDRLYEAGYKRMAESGEGGKIQLSVLGEVLPDEEW